MLPGVKAYPLQEGPGDMEGNMKLMLRKQMSGALGTSNAIPKQESYKVQMSPGRKCDNVKEWYLVGRS